MKYYIVITPFFPTIDKFYGSYIYDQVIALMKQEKSIIVLRPCPLFHKKEDYIYNGVRVSYFHCVDMPSYILNGLTDNINKLLFLRFLKRRFNLNSIDVEAVHCHTSQCALYGNIVKKIFPKSLSIIQYHDLDPFTILNGHFAGCKWNLRYKVRKTSKKLEKFDIHVSVSKRVEENLLSFPSPSPREEYKPYLDRLKSIPSSISPLRVKRSIVLINGVDTSVFYNDHKHEQSSIFTIGCIANYIALKRHQCLIDAIEILKNRGVGDIKVKLVGNNPRDAFQRFKQDVEKRGLGHIVEFCPPYEHDKLHEFYNSIDLFVLPSVFEGLGCVFLESWACGTPFISCCNQGIDDLIVPEEKALWLISKDDSNELADKIFAYKEKRVKQHLTDSIDINYQIKSFLKKINL